jgi:hypothetical protein
MGLSGPIPLLAVRMNSRLGLFGGSKRGTCQVSIASHRKCAGFGGTSEMGGVQPGWVGGHGTGAALQI